MAVITDINALSTNPASNGPDGSVDPPSTLDDQLRYHGAFIATLRDGGGIPVGMCVPFVGGTSAPGWIKANGPLLSRTTYATLFAYAAAQGLVTEAAWAAGAWGRFSSGDGSTTFRAPDVRAMFVRGLDESRGIDAGRAIGMFQDQDNAPHAHGVTDPKHVHGDPGHTHTGYTDSQGDHNHAYQGWSPTGAGAGIGATTVYAPNTSGTASAGIHNHNIQTYSSGANLQSAFTGISLTSQGGEGRPKNVAFPWYIKF